MLLNNIIRKILIKILKTLDLKSLDLIQRDIDIIVGLKIGLNQHLRKNKYKVDDIYL